MKLFENYQSKRKLKEQIIALETENNMLKTMPIANIRSMERYVQKVAATTILTPKEIEGIGVSIDVIKRRIKHELIDYIDPFIEWNYEDEYSVTGMSTRYSGTLYVSTEGK